MMLTIREAADRLRVSASLVYRLVRSGTLPCVRIGLGQGRLRILAEDLEQYVASHREDGVAEAPTLTQVVNLRHIRVRG